MREKVTSLRSINYQLIIPTDLCITLLNFVTTDILDAIASPSRVRIEIQQQQLKVIGSVSEWVSASETKTKTDPNEQIANCKMQMQK